VDEHLGCHAGDFDMLVEYGNPHGLLEGHGPRGFDGS